MLSYIYWDPSPYVFSFVLPILGRPIVWYGVLFALGFFLGYYLYRTLLLTHLFLYPQYDTKEIKNEKKVIQKINELQIKYPAKATLCEKLNFLLYQGEILPISNNKSTRLMEFLLSQKEKILVKQRMTIDSYFAGALSTLSFKAQFVAEKLTFSIALASIMGARLAEVIFYQNIQELIDDPLMFFRVWEGGLASHGGAFAAVIVLLLQGRRLSKIYRALSILKFLDLAVIPACLIGALIRLGNFMNQEILGHTTTVAWAVVFGHPADGTPPVPRHPVQLYEMLAYFSLFLFYAIRWRSYFQLKVPGKLFVSGLLSIFSMRFLLEFFKTEQSVYLSQGNLLTMGQYLSLPILILGLYFYRRLCR